MKRHLVCRHLKEEYKTNRRLDREMRDWKKLIVSSEHTVLETLRVINEGLAQAALVCEQDGKLLGILTDGDMRRAFMRGVELERKVRDILPTECAIVTAEMPLEDVFDKMKKMGLRHMPVVNDEGKISDFYHVNDFLMVTPYDNPVLLMAGGLGTRLYPLTNDTPKPLLKVGSKPMLQTILESFIRQGFSNFYMSVNYKAEMLEDYFGDGSKWNVSIQYLREQKRLGTAGCLSLFEQQPDKPLIVTNSDVLTKVNFQSLLDFHNALNAPATMCVREFDMQVPYGVINVDRYAVQSIIEKPIQRYFINAGIYVLNPECLRYVPHDEFYNMTDLLEMLIEQDRVVGSYPIRDYWVDVGKPVDFERAKSEYSDVFDRTPS